jgi:hypothetical protein
LNTENQLSGPLTIFQKETSLENADKQVARVKDIKRSFLEICFDNTLWLIGCQISYFYCIIQKLKLKFILFVDSAENIFDNSAMRKLKTKSTLSKKM